jgi:hypothetical protein
MSAEQHWTYKVAKVKYGDEYRYDIREYYELPDGPAWSSEAQAPMGESIEDLIQALRWMLKAAEEWYPGVILELTPEGDAV